MQWHTNKLEIETSTHTWQRHKTETFELQKSKLIKLRVDCTFLLVFLIPFALYVYVVW